MNREDLADILNLPSLRDYLAEVDELIMAMVDGSIFKKDIKNMLNKGGKRLRAALLIRLAITQNKEPNKPILAAAAAVELIHQASLAHDSISDDELSNQQIGRVLLLGDYLLATAFSLASSVSMEVSSVLSEAIQTMAQGQLDELTSARIANISDSSYLAVIQSKTASLFMATCQTGARLANLDENQVEMLSNYGMCFGVAFQIVDDIIDNDFTSKNKTEAIAAAQNYLQTAQEAIADLKIPAKKSLLNLASEYSKQTLR